MPRTVLARSDEMGRGYVVSARSWRDETMPSRPARITACTRPRSAGPRHRNGSGVHDHRLTAYPAKGHLGRRDPARGVAVAAGRGRQLDDAGRTDAVSVQVQPA